MSFLKLGRHPRENYIFEEKNGVTTFTVDMETTDEYHNQMLEMWLHNLIKA